MANETTSPVLQVLRLRSKSEDNFAPQLALAIHRQSTSPGFVCSIEGDVMAKANSWIALVAWSAAEHAERATREWFTSDYFADFADSVRSVESNDLHLPSPETFESIRASRYSTYARVDDFDLSPEFPWPEFLARRKTFLHACEGFDESFSFVSGPDRKTAGLVSTWRDARLMRSAAEQMDVGPSESDPALSSRVFLRVTSMNAS